MSLENNQSPDSQENQQDNGNINSSRRSFAKTSAAVAPVIMTLVNRSAWGANACIGSGFQSYSTAVKNGQTHSHAAPNPDGTSPYANWKTPAEWGGVNGHQSWPYQDGENPRVVPVRLKTGTNRFERWTASGWAENRLVTYARNNWSIAFLDQLLGSSYPTRVTIYDQLQSSNSNLLAYQIATEMNLLIYPVSVPTPNFAAFTLDDFVLFYSNCL